MAIYGEVSPSAKALNEARDKLISLLRGISIGTGTGQELVRALEQFLDARDDFKRSGY